jgi:hypothetical protein
MCLLSRWLATSNRDMLSVISNVFLSFQIVLLCSNFIWAIIVWSLWTSCAHTSRSTFTSYTGPTRTLSWKLSINFLVHAYPLAFASSIKSKSLSLKLLNRLYLIKTYIQKFGHEEPQFKNNCSTYMNLVASLSL